MATMTFRFTTECEMQLQGDTYEDIYLQFKDFMHGDQAVTRRASMRVYPPESVQVFFDLNASGEMHEIPRFKGSFEQDIKSHCRPEELTAPHSTLPRRAINCFQEDWSVYWH